jgi:hypothetical protein
MKRYRCVSFHLCYSLVNREVHLQENVMKLRTPAVCIVAALLSVTQAAPAFAYGRDWHGHGGGRGGFHGGGPILGLLGIGAAIGVGAVELATAPFQAIAAASGPGYDGGGYAPQPQAYAQPQYASPQPQYAPQYAQAYPPQAYYAPPPVYYAPQPVYYGRPYYGRY